MTYTWLPAPSRGLSKEFTVISNLLGKTCCILLIKSLEVLTQNIGDVIILVEYPSTGGNLIITGSSPWYFARIFFIPHNSSYLISSSRFTVKIFELSKDFGNGLIGRNMYENTSKLTKPVLVIQARNDQAVPYLYGVKYAVSYKNSRLHIVKDAGHGYDSLENATELYEKVVEFLK